MFEKVMMHYGCPPDSMLLAPTDNTVGRRRLGQRLSVTRSATALH